jgi:hypothetical protein
LNEAGCRYCLNFLLTTLTWGHHPQGLTRHHSCDRKPDRLQLRTRPEDQFPLDHRYWPINMASAQQSDMSEKPYWVIPFIDLPPPCLRAIVLGLWLDPRDVASLACCCSFLASFCGEQQLWRELLMRRYGKDALPAEQQAPGGWVRQTWASFLSSCSCNCLLMHYNSAFTATAFAMRPRAQGHLPWP